MREVMYNEYANEVLQAISKGAFLNVSAEGIDNIMTIGWGALSYMWRKPVLVVMVRYSRYTYELLEKTDTFTVSIPFESHGLMKEALKICGTLSGRECDKWQKASLTKLPAQKVNAPLVGECDLHYECKIIGKTSLAPGMLDESIQNKFYSKDDYHVLYYGEILGTYVK